MAELRGIPAAAYIDGGTAAMLFQVLAASVLGALFFFKTLWASMVMFFRRILGVFGRTRPVSETDG